MRPFILTHTRSNTAKKLILGTSLTIALLAFFLIGQQTFAAIELSYFRVEVTNSLDVQIEWGTELEETAGFLIKRATVGGTPQEISVLYEGSTHSFIPAAGGILGSDYVVIDETAVAGETYIYYLYEVETDNTQEQVASTQIVIEEETSTTEITNNSSSDSSSSGNTSPTATATTRPTSTPQPTSTAPPSSHGLTSSSTTTNSNGGSATDTTSSSGRATTTPASSTNSTESEIESTAAETDSSETTADEANATTNESEPEDEIASTTVTTIGEATPEGAEEIESEGVSIVEASEITQDDAYPYPGVEATATTDEDYVAPTIIPQTTVTPAEIGTTDIGEEGGETVSDSDAEETGADNNNRFVLWGIFLSALLLFIAGILGALILFRRRGQED